MTDVRLFLDSSVRSPTCFKFSVCHLVYKSNSCFFVLSPPTCCLSFVSLWQAFFKNKTCFLFPKSAVLVFWILGSFVLKSSHLTLSAFSQNLLAAFTLTLYFEIFYSELDANFLGSHQRFVLYRLPTDLSDLLLSSTWKVDMVEFPHGVVLPPQRQGHFLICMDSRVCLTEECLFPLRQWFSSLSVRTALFDELKCFVMDEPAVYSGYVDFSLMLITSLYYIKGDIFTYTILGSCFWSMFLLSSVSPPNVHIMTVPPSR